MWAVLRVGSQTAEERDDGQLGQQRKQAAMRESHVSGDAAITKRRAPKPRGGSLRKTDLNPSLGLLGLLKTFRAVPLGMTQSPGCTDTQREEPEGQEHRGALGETEADSETGLSSPGTVCARRGHRPEETGLDRRPEEERNRQMSREDRCQLCPMAGCGFVLPQNCWSRPAGRRS